jgi:T5SS/PEP-CTERM-associated repeat protein/autotransporter-associated beta strand protein
LQFGNESSGNSLVISNGGRVANRGTGNTTCFVGYSESLPVTKTSNNSVLVTGINSTWDIQGILGVGGYGHGNRLVISNGGSVLSQQGGVGLGNNPDLNSSNNSVLVTGAGSMWSNSQTLRVASGGSNSLTVADGGSVYAPAGIIIEGESTFDDPGGALNIGRLGTNDAGGTITGAIHFGGTGALLNFNQSNTAIVGNLITGTGNFRQRGTGVTILTASNTFNGSVRVLGGTLRLQSATGSALGSVVDITVNNGTLVLAANSQIKTNAGVTLSRGTLVLGDGVTQSLSSLTTSGNNASTLDFGASGASSLNFGNYQPQTSFRLKLQNFAAGDSFAFTLPNYQIHNFSNYFEIVGNYVGHTTQTGQDTYNVISLGTQQYVDWTHSYGLDPASSTGATAGTPAADPDGDGFDNNEEYAFGGNPTNGTPALLVMASSNISFIGLKSAPSGYIVQNTTNLSTGPWTNYPVVLSNTAPPFPIPQPDSYQGMGFTVPLTPGTNNFYRVIFSNQ